jgi:hypothetical protein
MVHAVGDTPPAHPDPLQPIPSDDADNSSPMDELVVFEQQSILNLPAVFSDAPFLVSDQGGDGRNDHEAGNEAGPIDPGETPMGLPSPSPSQLSLSVWQGRWIVIGAAAIYGTNFAAIKLLDPVLPVPVSAALRFCLAAAAVTAAVVWNEAAKAKSAATANAKRVERGNFSREDWESWWLGGEVGAWYCVGYLCQAWGLHYVDASKVSRCVGKGRMSNGERCLLAIVSVVAHYLRLACRAPSSIPWP